MSEILEQRFKLTIHIGNDEMHTADQIASALEVAAKKVRSGHLSGSIFDVNGNSAGHFWVCCD